VSVLSLGANDWVCFKIAGRLSLLVVDFKTLEMMHRQSDGFFRMVDLDHVNSIRKNPLDSAQLPIVDNDSIT
jgi:hypothetical protein